LELSLHKSKAVVFSCKRTSCEIVPNLKIKAQDVSFVNSICFLEIFLDSHLSGSAKYTCNISSRRIEASSISFQFWRVHDGDLTPKHYLTSTAPYGCQMFKFYNNLTLFDRLQRLKYRAIGEALRYCISTLINVMMAEARELPLGIRFCYF